MIKIWNGYWTKEDCKNNPSAIFIFGDNEDRRGCGGQATIRPCNNTYGLRTKRHPLYGNDAYWTDDTYDYNIKLVDEDIKVIKKLAKTHDIILSSGGYGSGLAELPKRAPKTYKYIVDTINKLIKETNK